MNNLPDKTETVIKCELSSWQLEMYKSLTQAALGVKNKFMNGKSISLNNTLMQLRKVCNHPYLFFNEGWDINDVIIKCCGKFDILDRMLVKLRRGGHRVLIFTQMTQVISIMEDYLAYRGYDHLRLDGSTSAEEREKVRGTGGSSDTSRAEIRKRPNQFFLIRRFSLAFTENVQVELPRLSGLCVSAFDSGGRARSEFGVR
jgi:hypothetical protein